MIRSLAVLVALFELRACQNANQWWHDQRPWQSTEFQNHHMDRWSNLPDFWRRNLVLTQDTKNSPITNSAFKNDAKPNITGKYTDVECKGDQDCHKINVTLSCMGATPRWPGRCMPPLKPMEHGCVFDDQCQKTCQESFCAMDQKFKNPDGEHQCRCHKGHYYLWKKCWNNCLPGTIPVHVDVDHWVCQEVQPEVAKKYMKRHKRETNRRLAC